MLTVRSAFDLSNERLCLKRECEYLNMDDNLNYCMRMDEWVNSLKPPNFCS